MSSPAEGYESIMVPTLFGPWAEALIRAAQPQPGERVLDVGCGTGIVARRVAARLGEGAAVTGLDPSEAMLAIARSAAAREGCTIGWRQGRAEQLPFSAGSFELVLCQFALMFCADKAAALAEMRRVMAQNGRVLIAVWQGLERHPFYRTLHAVIEKEVGLSALKEIFGLGDADALRALATDAGFREIGLAPQAMTARFPQPDRFLTGEIEVDTAAIPSMQHLDAEARQSIVAAISTAMQPALAQVTHHDHVVLPFHAHILIASG